MAHDDWSNVLFLHWKLPLTDDGSNLESILDRHVFPFQVERHMGYYWVGLVLLTENNVGPAFSWCRSRHTCVSHYGVNVRTYVTGKLVTSYKEEPRDVNDGNERNGCAKMESSVTSKEENSLSASAVVEKRGIHFASLECNNLITTIGANFFGMPYRYATIEREFRTGKTRTVDQPEAIAGFEITCSRVPWFMDVWNLLNKFATMLRNASLSSLFGYFYAGSHGDSKGTRPEEKRGPDDKKNNVKPLSDNFSVQCSWDRQGPTNEIKIGDVLRRDVAKVPEASFFVERYLVYTRKYFLNWFGRVHHDPWPVERAVIRSLKIRNVDKYRPVCLQPILQYMADHDPDSVLFSPGVGPIVFDMLRPVML